MLDMPRLGSGISLVAREPEMERLRAAVRAATAGSAAALLVAGDAGVGKTRITEEATALATDAGMLVLTGRCLDVGENGLPYLAFAEALGGLRDGADADLLADPALAGLLPGSGPVMEFEPDRFVPAPPSAAGTRRREQDVGQLRLFEAVYGLLVELAERHGVVLVLEDLHWADGATRAMVSFLLTRLRGRRLLILATYRTDDLHRRHPLRPHLAELLRLPAVERVDLAPFASADARDFVAKLAEDKVSDEVIRAVAERSEGNAFFAEELLAAYDDCREGMPATLVDVLLARMERLSEPAQRVVRVASVAGRRVRHTVLAAVADLPEEQLEQALREAVQHNVLVSEGETYSFRHALLSEAVYNDLLPGERVRLHGGYARVLADPELGRGRAGALAHHSLESHDLPTALAASITAAGDAERSSAPAVTLTNLELALKLWDAVDESQRPKDVTELDLLTRASWAAGTSGEPERAIAYARSAVTMADGRDNPELAAWARRRLAQALFLVDGKEAEALEVLRTAWGLVEHRLPSVTRAWVQGVFARGLRMENRFDEAREHAAQAIEAARAVGSGGAEADALTTLAVLEEGAGRLSHSAELLAKAMQRATEVKAITVELRARFALAVASYEGGLVDDALRALDAGVVRAEESGMLWSDYGFELWMLQVIARYVSGDWDGSEQAAEPAGRRVSGAMAARLASAGALVMVGRGRFAEAERLVKELRADWHLDLQIALSTGAVAADLACWRGRPQDAARWVSDALGWAQRAGGQWRMAGIKMAAFGVAAHADIAHRPANRKDPEAVAAAVAEGEQLAAHAHGVAERGTPRSGTLGPEGKAWVARADAELSRLRGPNDPARWQAVVDAFDYGAVYDQVVCRWRLAEALLAADRREEAAEELRKADEVAGRLGAKPLADALRALARRARIPLDGVLAVRDTVDPLTPREKSVLTLVASGRTNREVGEELFISEKTVSVHLSRVMAKLGATRRAEAVAIAYDRELL
jgi:DNA-binding CsgD family transcriptional regulator